MSLFYVISYYFVWHYSRALLDVKNIIYNFLFFLYHFFSISLILSTFFQPWRRVEDGYGKPGEGFFETFIFNTMMRIVGMVMRTFIIATGVLSLVFGLALGVGVFFVWLVLPALWIGLVVVSIKNLI